MHFVNDEEECEYKETVNYTKFEGVSLMKPFKGTGYSVSLKPGEKRTIVIRQDDPLGYSLNQQIMQSALKLSSKITEQLCKTGPGQKTTQRLDPSNKQPVEIYKHEYKHNSGIAMFYENKTANRTLEEQLSFTMSGMQIVGNEPNVNDVKISLKPGQTKLIELEAVSFPWKFATKCGYLIK